MHLHRLACAIFVLVEGWSSLSYYIMIGIENVSGQCSELADSRREMFLHAKAKRKSAKQCCSVVERWRRCSMQCIIPKKIVL